MISRGTFCPYRRRSIGGQYMFRAARICPKLYDRNGRQSISRSDDLGSSSKLFKTSTSIAWTVIGWHPFLPASSIPPKMVGYFIRQQQEITLNHFSYYNY